MANEKRVRQNFIGGLVDTADLAAAGTTLNSAALAAIATTIDSTNHMAITLDPDGLYGAPEIAYITAYTPGATTATILRGQEGTAARQHLLDTPWVHGPTVRDLDGDSAWTDATLLNLWVAYGAPYANPGYRKAGSREVRLRGMVKNGTLGSPIFTLPAGYRPGAQILVPTMLGGNNPGLATITTGGDVTAFQGAGPVGTNAFVALDHITFYAEA